MSADRLKDASRRANPPHIARHLWRETVARATAFRARKGWRHAGGGAYDDARDRSGSTSPTRRNKRPTSTLEASPSKLKLAGDGSPVVPHMGSYGVGVSRLVGAIIEASHDDAGIVWPEAVAPWKVGIVTMRVDEEATVAAAEKLYSSLQDAGVEVLYDDRDERGGVKLGSMDLIGLPWQIVIGPRGIANGTVELKNRRTGEKEEISAESALSRLTA